MKNLVKHMEFIKKVNDFKNPRTGEISYGLVFLYRKRLYYIPHIPPQLISMFQQITQITIQDRETNRYRIRTLLRSDWIAYRITHSNIETFEYLLGGDE